MEIKQHHPLREYHTFAIDTTADWWINYSSAEDLQTLARDEYFVSQPYLPIGAGSNLLFTHETYRGVILYSQIDDLHYYDETESALTHPGQQHVRAGSGIVWDHFVELMLSRGLYGVENWSLIPGTVGAAAIQNIGAYGSEVSQYIVAVDVVDLATGMKLRIPSALCDYKYRYSIFKDPQYHSYIVTHVHFILSTEPTCNLSYASLAKAFEGRDTMPTPEEIRQEVIRIRRAKLPDPEEIPNGGSFFMNPIVPLAQYEELAKQYDTPVPHYPIHNGGEVKLSAAWLIDQTGLKGYRTGAVGVYEKQPLVLVNYGGATGQEVVALAEHVQQEVSRKFGISLRPEVRYID